MRRNQTNLNLKKCLKLAGNAVCALSVLFVLSTLWRTDFDFGQVENWRMFFTVCAAGIVLKAATVFLSAGAWCLWLEFFSGRRLERREALHVYAKANIGKYLPGNVMHYVERSLFAGKLDLSKKQAAAATLCEIASLVLAALFLGTVLAFSQVRDVLAAVFSRKLLELKTAGDVLFSGGSCGISGTGAAVLFAVAVSAAVLAAAYAFIRWLKRQKCAQPVLVFGKSFLLYVLVLAVLGLIFVCLYWYWAGKPQAGEVCLMMAAYSISWMLGFAVPGAPGGIGVREMALSMLLSPVMDGDVIAVLSVLHRMITVAGDFLAYLLRGRG